MKLSGWGNYPRLEVRQERFRGEDALAPLVAGAASLIARGNGRAYGDAALNRDLTLSTLAHDRLLAFDPDSGRLTCEAGVLLSDLVAIFLPRGWFVPVTPGTRLVTVGGMIAADVHGKNHHRDGSFGRHVESLRLMTSEGVVTCSPTERPALFRATIGGMGLTGVIVEATFRLVPVESAWIRQETVPCGDLETVMAAFDESAGWTYTVAWIDCLARGRHAGRSLLYRGEHARAGELPAGLRSAALRPLAKRRLRVPLDLPSFTLNRLSVAAFNALYYGKGRAAKGAALIDAETFFYPLDAILEWNRIYGGAGFVQYQCVLPLAASRAGLALLLERIAAAGSGSFLAVLKLFGPGDAGGGLLSFPMEGYTLALDFPASAATFSLLTELDAIVADHGGRIYLAKDARMGVHLLRSGYGEQLSRFLSLRDDRFQSALSRRLGL